MTANLKPGSADFRPGAHVRITLKAVVDDEGDYLLGARGIIDIEDGDDASRTHCICSDYDGIVEVKQVPRELPTADGALVLAHLVGPTAVPTFLVLGEHDGSPAWFYQDAVSFGPVFVSEIAEDWVHIDRETLRPVQS